MKRKWHYNDIFNAQCHAERGYYIWWAKKLHTAFFAITFAYSQPIFIIFGLYKPQEICNWKVYS